jgi:undecaprenyl-diphosphatase
MIAVFKNINRFADKSRFLDLSAIFFGRIAPYLMVIFLFGYSIYVANIYLFIYAMISGLSARFIINELVHLFYKEERPAYLKETKVLIPVPKNYSFPSGHASFLFGMSFFVFFYNINLAIIFVLFSFLVGFARVFCGVHWFRDILGGFFAGFLSVIIVHYLLTIL